MSRLTAHTARYALVAAVAMLFALAGPAFAQDAPSPIVSGPTTADQAVAWSQATFANNSAPDVILARDDDFPDALGAGALQALLQAPLLLTNSTLLSPQTATEITRVGAENVIILGGEEAVAPTVVTALEALGLTTERVNGANRADTARLIATTYFPNATEVLIARADAPADNPTAAFADSIAAATYSSVANVPVLLTNGETLLPEMAAALGAMPIERVIIAGGESAIDAATATAILEAVTRDGDDDAPLEIDRIDRTLDRLAGPSRSATAIALATDLGYVSAGDASRVILVNGEGDDAWAAGFSSAAQAGNGAATVLALQGTDVISPDTVDYLAGSAGTPLICAPGVSQDACDAAFAAMTASS